MVCHICNRSLLIGDLSAYSCGCVVHTQCLNNYRGERCPECDVRIQVHHRIYLEFGELLENIQQLLRFLQLVEENARRRQRLLEAMQRGFGRR